MHELEKGHNSGTKSQTEKKKNMYDSTYFLSLFHIYNFQIIYLTILGCMLSITNGWMYRQMNRQTTQKQYALQLFLELGTQRTFRMVSATILLRTLRVSIQTEKLGLDQVINWGHFLWKHPLSVKLKDVYF